MKAKRTRGRHRGVVLIGGLAVSALVAAVALLSIFGGGLWGADRARRNVLTQAHTAFVMEDFGRAETLLRISDSRTKTPEARILLGRVLLRLGRVSEAETVFSEILKDAPDHPRATLGLAESQEASGDTRRALRTYRKAVDLAPENPDSWRKYGMAQYQAGDAIGSMFSFRKSLTLLPGQEDLSRLVNEIGTSDRMAQGFPGAGQGGRRQGPGAGFGGVRNPTPGVPQRLRQFAQPSVPDPLEGLPVPGGVRGGRRR